MKINKQLQPLSCDQRRNLMACFAERRTPNRKRYFGNPNGFTMIEIIISIVIMGILSIYTFSFLGDSMGAYVRVKEHKILYDEARIAMERMALEIRNAGRSSITIGTSSISFDQPSSILEYPIPS